MNSFPELLRMSILKMESFFKVLVLIPPHQNGVVERKHSHILKVARVLRFEVGLQVRF